VKISLGFLILATVVIFSCHNSDKGIASKRESISVSIEYNKGEYGYDLEFLKKHLNPVELINNGSRLIILPEYQGRVMTSSSSGLKGFSYGWINYDLISSSTIQEHFNPYGGEERIWLGPEGGQFSLYFKKDTTFKSIFNKNIYSEKILKQNNDIYKELEKASIDYLTGDIPEILCITTTTTYKDNSSSSNFESESKKTNKITKKEIYSWDDSQNKFILSKEELIR